MLLPLLAAMLLVQEPAPRRLPAAELEAPDGVSTVVSLIELTDGRILLSDGKDKALYVIDFAKRTMKHATSTGSGPKEYAQPGGLYRMRNGEIRLLDQTQRRYLRLRADGTPVNTVPFHSVGGAMSFSSTFNDPHQLDGDGNEYERERPGRGGAMGPEAWLTRRSATRTDSLARLRNPESEMRDGGGFRILMTVSFSPSDGFAVARDGSIALVRAEPYRVEWRAPNGKMVQGPALTFTPQPITAADKAEVEARRRSVQLPGNVRISRPDGSTFDPSSSVPEPRYAAAKPAFVQDPIRIDEQDRVWVRRHAAVGAPALYDVFDRQGVRVDRVELPPRTTLAGFGRGVVYLARADADDLLWIGRVAY